MVNSKSKMKGKALMQSFLKPFITACCLMSSMVTIAQTNSGLQFDFETTTESRSMEFNGKGYTFSDGIKGKALSLSPEEGYGSLTLSDLRLDGERDFTVQFWVKTTSDKANLFLSQKDFKNKGITTQKNAGWAIFSSGGTLGWTIGSGKRRITYERDNGNKMPLNDGEWHQITMSYQKSTAQLWLYYDGLNKAIYNVGFDFSNEESLRIGVEDNGFDYDNKLLDEIVNGRDYIQEYVNAFNKIGAEPLKDSELLDLIANPQGLLKNKQEKRGKEFNRDDLASALDIRRKLDPSPYTVFQNKKLTALKPVNQIYSLANGEVRINQSVAKRYTENEKLHPSDFVMDELSILNRPMNPEEVLNSFRAYKKGSKAFKYAKRKKNLTIGVWNIWHGGIHWSEEKDGWDSRKRIVEMIKEKEIDVILMQETYSGGDFIAAELDYYFATTSDWDYKFQGSNISVISKYPIKDIKVTDDTEFNNVAVKLAISKTQEVWAMSNWYGMNNFPKVYDFHESRFAGSDDVPIFFGGDFNAVPHTDGGKSPASKKMLEEGFTDAFRSLYPSVSNYPGYTHQSGSRIDQLYYRGKVENISTEVISTWPTGFPSDHFLIVSKFKLNY